LLVPALGFNRGFATYEIVGPQHPPQGKGLEKASAAELHARVAAWLATPRERQRPFFLYVQSFDVHSPYTPPQDFLGRFAGTQENLAPVLTFFPEEMDPATREVFREAVSKLEPWHYDDAIAYNDFELGGLVDRMAALGLRESTVIVVTADHGESLGEGGRFTHGLSLNEELLHIPLIVALPWVERPIRLDNAVVSLVDVEPTLLVLAGIQPPGRV